MTDVTRPTDLEGTTRILQEFPPHVLREYAFLADGERGVIVGPRGDFAWMCLPGWDGASIFSALVGGPGVFAVTPISTFVWGGYYEEGTLIWRDRWVTDDAVIECRDALAMPSRANRAVLLRRVVAREGRARVRVVLDVRAGYGSFPLRDLHCDGDVWTGRSGEVHLRLCANAPIKVEEIDGGSVLSFELDLAEGGQHDLVLEVGTRSRFDDRLVSPDVAWHETEHSWAASAPPLSTSLAPRDSRHAYAILRGLTAASGGTVAAATTSLPERAERGRNYDYRYVWIRDLCYIGHALAAAGAPELFDSGVGFVVNRLLADGPRMRPAYTADGGLVPGEDQLPMPGYPGGYDMIGNRVTGQFQLDVFGEALLLLADAAELGRLDADGWHAGRVAAEAIASRWQEPDSGIWEIAPKRWTHSRLICAAGLRRISRSGAPPSLATDWLALADRLVAEVGASAVHPSGRWQRADDDDRVDAALLIPGIRGAVPPNDPRVVATLAAVRTELTRDGYVYRFRPDERELGAAEGAFLLCGLVSALAAHQQGEAVEAARMFERHRASCGPPALFSEEYDVQQRQMRGNLPQAFVHALLLESSVRLARPWQDALN